MANQDPYTSAGDGDKILARYIRLFELSWRAARDYFTRATEDVAQYEQEININNWPTLSEITLAEAKKFVDQAVPSIISYIFGSEAPFNYTPADRTTEWATARKVRDWVLFNMRTNMRIETGGYLSIKEAVKLGKGYGIIEPKVITPPASEEEIVVTEEETIRNRVMGVGKAELVPGYTYLPFGTVVPTPDGPTPDEVSCVFVLRLYQEEVFRKMFDKKLNPDTPFEGPLEKIIALARTKAFNGYLSTPRQIAAQIANLQRQPTEAMNEAVGDDNTPVIIPVLQCYARDEHVWFACDRYRIYHTKSKRQTLRCPVVASTFDPDGVEWFTPGIIRPRRRMIMGVETFYNALFDLLSMTLHPHQIVNRDALVSEEEKTGLEPYGRTMISGQWRTGDAVSWAQLPPLPPYVFNAGEKLEDFNAASVGQPRSLQGQGTPGLVRGGSGAMESLLQTSTGREKQAARHIENGWYASVVENALVLCQMLAKNSEFMPKLIYNPEDKDDKLEWTEITRDDIRRVYNLQLNFTEKLRNAVAEATVKAMVYDRAMQHEGVNRDEAFAYLVGDDQVVKRLMSGAKREDNIRIMQELGAGRGRAPGAAGGAPGEFPIPAGAGQAMAGLTA